MGNALKTKLKAQKQKAQVPVNTPKEIRNIPLKWKNVVNAVRHEMTEAIAQSVESASSNLGDFDAIHPNYAGKALISAIEKSDKRTLTVSEAQYLRTLIHRAKRLKYIPLSSADNS